MTVSVVLAISFVLLIVATSRYPGYSIKTHWISNLGEARSKTRSIFLVATGFIFIAGIYTISLLLLQEGGLTLKIGALILSTALLFLLPTMYIPMDRNLELHTKVGGVMFLFINVGMMLIVFSPHFYGSPTLLMSTISVIVFVNLLGYASGILYRKFGAIPANLVEIRDREQNIIVKNATVWEWVTILTILLWIVLINEII